MFGLHGIPHLPAAALKSCGKGLQFFGGLLCFKWGVAKDVPD